MASDVSMQRPQQTSKSTSDIKTMQDNCMKDCVRVDSTAFRLPNIADKTNNIGRTTDEELIAFVLMMYGSQISSHLSLPSFVNTFRFIDWIVCLCSMFAFISLLSKPAVVFCRNLAHVYGFSDEQRHGTKLVLFERQWLSCGCCARPANMWFVEPVDCKLVDAFNLTNSLDKYKNDVSFKRFRLGVLIRHPYSLRYTAWKW